MARGAGPLGGHAGLALGTEGRGDPGASHPIRGLTNCHRKRSRSGERTVKPSPADWRPTPMVPMGYAQSKGPHDAVSSIFLNVPHATPRCTTTGFIRWTGLGIWNERSILRSPRSRLPIPDPRRLEMKIKKILRWFSCFFSNGSRSTAFVADVSGIGPEWLGWPDTTGAVTLGEAAAVGGGAAGPGTPAESHGAKGGTQSLGSSEGPCKIPWQYQHHHHRRGRGGSWEGAGV